MSGLRGVTLTVRFLRELAMLAALAYWGFTVGDGVGGPSSAALSRRRRAALRASLIMDGGPPGRAS